MNRTSVFSFRLSIEERRIISDLASQYQRSQSDVIRLLIRDARKKLPNLGKDKKNQGEKENDPTSIES